MKQIHFLWHFGKQQALSCIFPVLIFTALLIAKVTQIPMLPDYDFILIVCIVGQWLMLRLRLESRDELIVICVFHIIGLVLELFKVRMGSWSYPQDAYSKWFGVPLYSGFMYASVASYLCQAWRRLQVGIVNWPSAWMTVPLGAAIYLNFMTHHYWLDLRWWLTAALFPVFWRTSVTYVVQHRTYRMPLILSFVLIGFFIWVAENISTYLGAWQYPDQAAKWTLVHLGKISSWFLLVIVSFIIVAQLKHVKTTPHKAVSQETGPL
ncbi:hypothetical protein SY83_22175 [Paenibacillus swuensis]|uniref:Integral membrane protein n=1 Tax=Paenibacillus swuensis TaxID=1178515 RepID=A0A172TNI6_9BACL|nr:DUF817 domain-containing protein [Paenibacillus swuensis]ANE48542.1 hypothetical protein SY83_22175 [Paenibacillus swuensis]